MSDEQDRIDVLKSRLRGDLRAAMKAKATREIAVLRTLIAALDNAEAIPLPPGHTRYVERAFGDPASEVARRRLTAAEVDAVLQAERDERLKAAEELETAGRADDAAALKADADLVQRYLADDLDA